MRRPAITPLVTALVVSLVFGAVVCPVFPAASAHAAETEAERNARLIADAQDDANEAGQAIIDAEEKLETITLQLGELQGEIAALQQKTTTLQQQVTEVAIRRFTGASSSNSPLLSSWDTPEQLMQVEAFTEVIVDNSDEAFDQYDSISSDLQDKQNSLQRVQRDVEQRKLDLAALQTRSEEKVKQLKAIEKQRLKDEATRRALEKERARRAADSATQASQALSSIPVSAVSGGSISNNIGGASATVKVGNTKLYGTYVQGGANGQGVKLGAGIGYPDLPFGSGGRPTTTGVDWSGSSWVCPTGAARTGFGHSFIPKTPGATRYHHGIDMSARQGTPLVAVVDGVAMAKIMPETGGMTVFLVGTDGAMYYYAHLEAWGQMGRVKKGTIIGYVGMTGRAGGYHLHFQYHPGGIGSAPVDPYNLLKAHC